MLTVFVFSYVASTKYGNAKRREVVRRDQRASCYRLTALCRLGLTVKREEKSVDATREGQFVGRSSSLHARSSSKTVQCIGKEALPRGNCRVTRSAEPDGRCDHAVHIESRRYFTEAQETPA